MDAAEALGADCYVFHGPAVLKRARKLVLNFEKIGKRSAKRQTPQRGVM